MCTVSPRAECPISAFEVCLRMDGVAGATARSAFSKFMCKEILISASDVRLRIGGVVGAATSFAGVHLAWIAGAICTKTYGTQY